MPGRTRKSPNPFYVVLLLASTTFVITALAYLIGPYEARRNVANPHGALSRALADWFDRHGPAALAVEFFVMLVTGVLAMATDHWFSKKPRGTGLE
jgi:hypothetical protein